MGGRGEGNGGVRNQRYGTCRVTVRSFAKLFFRGHNFNVDAVTIAFSFPDVKYTRGDIYYVPPRDTLWNNSRLANDSLARDLCQLFLSALSKIISAIDIYILHTYLREEKFWIIRIPNLRVS